VINAHFLMMTKCKRFVLQSLQKFGPRRVNIRRSPRPTAVARDKSKSLRHPGNSVAAMGRDGQRAWRRARAISPWWRAIKCMTPFPDFATVQSALG
jgi:hypothetical protein